MRRSNQQNLDGYQGGPNPGPAAPNDIRSTQESIYDANVQVAADILAARPQKAFRSADDASFQPSPSAIVGDMVSGQPRDGYSAQGIVVDLGADLATGGEPAGPLSLNQEGPQNFYRGIPDFPGGQGSGTAPQEPTSSQNPA